MRGLSLTQPWATLVASGAKEYETRSWPTSYRGAIAIHAAQGFPVDSRELCDLKPYKSALKAAGYARPTITFSDGFEIPDLGLGTRFWASVLPRGAIVAVANLHKVGRMVRCHGGPRWGIHNQGLPVSDQEVAFGDWSPGRYGWSLTSVRRLPEPIPYRGALGLWRVEPDLAARLEAWWLDGTPIKASR